MQKAKKGHLRWFEKMLNAIFTVYTQTSRLGVILKCNLFTITNCFFIAVRCELYEQNPWNELTDGALYKPECLSLRRLNGIDHNINRMMSKLHV